MRTQEERDEQTLEIASALLVGLVIFGAPIGVLLALASAFDVPESLVVAVLTVLAAGYIAYVGLRLSRMTPWSASSSRASARPSTPRPSSRPPRP